MTSSNQGFRANLELFKNRDFAVLWAGFTFSALGDMIYYIARIAVIMKLTGSALAVGGMSIFGLLPTVLMSLTGGALADRLNRQKLVVWSNFARGLIMVVLAGLIFSELIQSWHLYVAAFMNNTFYAISNPAFDAMLPSVVETDKLKHAYSLFSIGTNFAQIAGPAIGGFLVLISGSGGAIFFNGMTFLCMMVALVFIRPKISPLENSKRHSSIFSDIKDGWLYARKNNVIVIFFIAIAVFNLLSAFLILGGPFFITKTLKLDISWYGTMVVGINIGVILGGLLISSIQIQRRGLLVCLSFIGIGLVMSIIFSLTRSIWIAIFAMGLINLLLSFSNILMPTWIQTAVTDEYRGRVFSIMSTMSLSLSPIGFAIAGLALDRFDPSLVISVAGLGILATGFWMFSKKDMRELR